MINLILLQDALDMRQDGNNYFQQKDYHSAITAYSDGILAK
jgi:hypothetical protein